MEDLNSEYIDILTGLAMTCEDGEKGFREGAEAMKDPELKALLFELSEQREGFATELETEIARLGGDPDISGSPLGALHRGWINVRDVITGHDDYAILAECERGEDAAKDAYRTALLKTLPTDILEIVRRQAAAIDVAHDRIKSLRNASKADLI